MSRVNCSSREVIVIILNYNGWRDTIKCLESVMKQKDRRFLIAVVDNGSTDCSCSKLFEWAMMTGLNPVVLRKNDLNTGICIRPSDFLLVQALSNNGVHSGYNIAVDILCCTGCKYMLLLNNDTQLENECFIDLLVSCADSHPECGAISSWTREGEVEANRLWLKERPLLFLIPSLRRAWQGFVEKKVLSNGYCYIREGDKCREVSSIPGHCMMIKRDICTMRPVFDPNLFYGCEEVILAKKLEALGLSCWVEPKAVIVHNRGSCVTRRRSFIYYESLKSEMCYFGEYMSRSMVFEAYIVVVTRFLFNLIRMLTDHEFRQSFGRFMGGYATLVACFIWKPSSVRRLLKKRA